MYLEVVGVDDIANFYDLVNVYTYIYFFFVYFSVNPLENHQCDTVGVCSFLTSKIETSHLGTT